MKNFNKIIAAEYDFENDKQTSADDALNLIEEIKASLNEAIENFRSLEQALDKIGLHSADIKPYAINALQSLIEGNYGFSLAAEEEMINNFLNKE